MLAAYRWVYGVVSMLVLANLLTTHYYGDVPASRAWLILACKLSLAGVIFSVVLFSEAKVYQRKICAFEGWR